MGATMGKLGSCVGQKIPGCSKRGSDMLSLSQNDAELGWLLMYSELFFTRILGLPEEGKG